MLVDIQMPELGAEVTEGTLLAWLVSVGDEVSAGDPIAELETDKSTVELEADCSGTLQEIVVAEGSEGVQIGTVIAKIEASDGAAPAAGASESIASTEIDTAAELADDGEAEPAPDVEADPAAAATPAGAAVSASPLARRLAQQSGVDLSGVNGSGARGRIVRSDVEALTGGSAPVAAPPPAATKSTPPAPIVEDGPFRRVKHSAMRRTIARRLSESKQTVPHFYLRIACRVDEVMRVRRSLNAANDDVKVSVNDFVLRAVALGLRDVPEANVSWTDEAMLHYDAVDVSVAVATEGGLITPVVRDADRKGLATISGEVRELAGRAREGKLKPEEYQGGSFTVSNLGMYGIETVYPIVNPPQACILGVGAATQQAVVVDGQLEVGSVMMCTLSADHRAVDGAVGAQFMAAFKRFIEDPVSMVL